MQIPVKQFGYETVMNEDGEFVCEHLNLEISPPCCTTRGTSGYIECGCGGMYSFYCPDCNNDDLTDAQIQDALENYLDRGDYDDRYEED